MLEIQLEDTKDYVCQSIGFAGILVQRIAHIEDSVIPERAGIETATLGIYLWEARRLLDECQYVLVQDSPVEYRGVHGTGWHEVAYRIARTVYLGIVKAADWNLWLARENPCSVYGREEKRQDKAAVRDNWQCVREWLLTNAPDFDVAELTAQIRCESAMIRRRLPAVNGTENGHGDKAAALTATEIESQVGIDKPVAGEDFRNVRWYGGELYEFTATQAACVRILWQAWKKGVPVVGDSAVLEAVEAGDSQRLDLIFRGHPAWKKMIIPGNVKGTHRLAAPPDS
jgi:hypothetical protein